MWKNGMRSVVIGCMPFFVLWSIFFAGWPEEKVNNSVELRRRVVRRRRAVNQRMSSDEDLLVGGHLSILPSPPGKTALTGGDGSTPIPTCKFRR